MLYSLSGHMVHVGKYLPVRSVCNKMWFEVFIVVQKTVHWKIERSTFYRLWTHPVTCAALHNLVRCFCLMIFCTLCKTCPCIFTFMPCNCCWIMDIGAVLALTLVCFFRTKTRLTCGHTAIQMWTSLHFIWYKVPHQYKVRTYSLRSLSMLLFTTVFSLSTMQCG